MDGFSKKEGTNDGGSKFKQEIHSKVIRAGKRTYFFDVKSTRNEEYYLTITESKKKFENDGRFHFEKHKIFLYKEDFDKFADSLEEIIHYIRNNQPEIQDTEDSGSYMDSPIDEVKDEAEVSKELEKDYTSIEFEDLVK